MKQTKWSDNSLINDITQLCWSCILFFFNKSLFCKFLFHYESWILPLGSQHGFQKVHNSKGYFSLLQVIKWGSTACSHSKLHICQSSPFFHLHWSRCHRIKPSQRFASSHSNNCSQNLGTAFLLVYFFPFVSIPASSSHEKRNSACQSCRESFLPSPVMRG